MIHYKNIGTIALSALLLILVSNVLMAKNDPNYIIISGQVTNIDCGIAIGKHPVFIRGNSIKEGRDGYFKTVNTNREGYYYDTIYTNENKGSFEVFTYDFSGEAIDTTVYFRFIEKGNNIIIANFAIFLPYQAWKLQAKFNYTEEFDDTGLNKFKFIDQTENSDIIGWYWDFGDGSTSKLQNPTHQYRSYGLFIVRFTVTAIINNMPKTSTVTKQLYISEQKYYHLGGHVFSEYFPIDMGCAYLYLIDSANRYIAIDTIAFDTLGYYYFYQVPKGNYLVKAEPLRDSEYYGLLLPTYYGDKLFWEKAELIQLTQTNWECNINLAHSDGALTGGGSISGNIEYVNLPRSPLISAEGVNIYLFDDSDNLLTCYYSDELGSFIFDLIELNTYWLYPEVTGIQSEKIKVVLSPETPNVANVNISILPSGISYVFSDDEASQEAEVGLPYPNPVSETLNIPLNLSTNKTISFEIMDLYGHKIIYDNIGMMINSNSYNIPTTHLKNGTYILRTNVNSKIYNRVFIVAK